MFQGMDYVYEVYKEMNFSKAAKNLYISQPSLSAAVKKVETRLGFPIFDRSTTPIQLTEFGKEYIKAIEVIMDVENGFNNFVNDINELKSGSISIGGTNLFASYILPPLLSGFTEKYPFVDVNLVEASTSELTEKLFSGSLDLIIDNNCMDSSIYEKVFFCEEHLILTVPKAFFSNEKAKDYRMDLKDIKNGRHLEPDFPVVPLDFFRDEPFLFLKSGNDTRIRADKICHNSRFTPKIKLKLDQQITAYNLSSYGMGISFTGDILLSHIYENDNLVYYKLDNRDATRDVNFYYKRNRYMTRTVREFLKLN
ncbi:LysR family transcriptional regulator [[Clostridium] symbiosum]|uniref:LysR family transcriptional regulator n=1 Tax=Clostridium symbiosum TaxID=1512 RepID=UPI001D05C9E7|nr:LysR family transcriptional regulator [[Clostridium] symbiosum]MCB6609766.1 LysR family transcriptional regulator [[Clostridium] symbiosum]MCB6931279.1 LysR family transcriptional regulator [[Clostridium] symbiosum]